MKYLRCLRAPIEGGGRKGDFQEKYHVKAVVPGTVRNRNSHGEKDPIQADQGKILEEAQRQACGVPVRVEEQHFGKTEQNLRRPEEEIKIKYVPVHLDIWKTTKTCVTGNFYCPVPPPITLRTKSQPSQWPCLFLHPHPPVPIPHLLPSVVPLQSLVFFHLDLRVFALA